MKAETERIIELIEKSVNEQYNEFAKKQLLFLIEEIKQLCKDEESEDEESETAFKEAVEPAIRYLLKNHSPHTKIYIDYDNAELLEGQECHNLTNEIPD